MTGNPFGALDGYGMRHLAAHLAGASRAEELHRLVSEPWMVARFERSGYSYDGFVADLMLAWHQAHKQAQEQIAADQAPAMLATCVRYALIRTSIISLSANYVPGLVARAVETGLWSPERALSVADRVPDPGQRVVLFGRILATGRLDPDLSAQTAEAGLGVALAIGDEGWRAEALAALAPHLTGEALARGLESALAIGDEEPRAEALAAFVPLAPEPAAMLRRTRRAIADHMLKNLSAAERERLLRFCTEEKLFSPPLLDEDTLAAIAEYIVEVCEEWRWL